MMFMVVTIPTRLEVDRPRVAATHTLIYDLPRLDSNNNGNGVRLTFDNWSPRQNKFTHQSSPERSMQLDFRMVGHVRVDET